MEIPAFCSRWYPIFVRMGYPQLDIREFEDGEWAIIEMLNAPLVPSLVQWRYVLTGMRNVMITESFIEKYVRQIDPRYGEFWEREARATQKVEDEAQAAEKHRKDLQDHAFNAIRKNEDLCERIAKNGLAEMNLDKIVQHVDPKKLGARNVSHFLVSDSQNVLPSGGGEPQGAGTGSPDAGSAG